MKKLTLLLLLVSTNVFAGYYTGNDLVKWFNDKDNETPLYIYIAGVIDGIGVIEEYSKTICIAAGTTQRQIGQLTYNYMQKHPEIWTYSGSYFVILAVQEAYPCKK
jgi:hypothetical protein